MIVLIVILLSLVYGALAGVTAALLNISDVYQSYNDQNILGIAIIFWPLFWVGFLLFCPSHYIYTKIVNWYYSREK
jgi:ABC-type uncharacterized transport system permease subunit